MNGLDGLNSEKNVIKNSAMSNNILNKEGLESFKKFNLNENNNNNNNKNKNNNSNSNAPGYQITEKGTPRLKKKAITRKKSKKAFITRKRKTLNRSFRIMGKFDGNSINNNEPNKNKNINSPKLKFYNNININNVNNDSMKVNIINNRKSIKILTKNTKTYLMDQPKKKKKKSIFSYFKGNNFSDYELNELPYLKAVQYDKRTFLNYYWQLLRREHLIFFTFFSWGDYNIISIKLSKFIFAIVLDFAVNVVFFVDDSMHKIYLDYGKYNFISQIPQILYSTIASEALDVFLRYLALTEKDIYKIKKFEQNKDKILSKNKIFQILRCMRLKILCYFVVTFFFFCFFWYFVSAFCAVYKNSQSYLIKDSLTSLLMSLLYPFGLYLFPTGLRIIALRDKKKRLEFLYKLSDVIPLI